MRVTTDFWVSALIRRVSAAGEFAAVVKRGAAEAGAVFIVTRTRFGEMRLYGPAPQTSYDQARPEERFFSPLEAADEAAIEKKLEREARFDPDIWVVEIDPGTTAPEDLIAIAA